MTRFCCRWNWLLPLHPGRKTQRKGREVAFIAVLADGEDSNDNKKLGLFLCHRNNNNSEECFKFVQNTDIFVKRRSLQSPLTVSLFLLKPNL